MNDAEYELAKRMLDELIDRNQRGELSESEKRKMSRLMVEIDTVSRRRYDDAVRKFSRFGQRGCVLALLLGVAFAVSTTVAALALLQ